MATTHICTRRICTCTRIGQCIRTGGTTPLPVRAGMREQEAGEQGLLVREEAVATRKARPVALGPVGEGEGLVLRAEAVVVVLAVLAALEVLAEGEGAGAVEVEEGVVEVEGVVEEEGVEEGVVEDDQTASGDLLFNVCSDRRGIEREVVDSYVRCTSEWMRDCTSILTIPASRIL